MREESASKYGRSGRFAFLLAATVVGLLANQSAAASVLTAPLQWQATSIEAGLERIKAQFLDTSIREDTEFVGAVLRAGDGNYEFTQGHGLPGQDRVTFRIQRPHHTEVVGLWHTHGGHGPSRSVFSPTDAELVRQTGLPFYLITPEGEIRVLRPEHVKRPFRGSRLKGSMARLPRGSHPGERVTGRSAKPRPPRGCADVIKV